MNKIHNLHPSNSTAAQKGFPRKLSSCLIMAALFAAFAIPPIHTGQLHAKGEPSNPKAQLSEKDRSDKEQRMKKMRQRMKKRWNRMDEETQRLAILNRLIKMPDERLDMLEDAIHDVRNMSEAEKEQVREKIADLRQKHQGEVKAMRKRWNEMPDEKKRRLKEKMKSMSPEQRKALREKLKNKRKSKQWKHRNTRKSKQ